MHAQNFLRLLLHSEKIVFFRSDSNVICSADDLQFIELRFLARAHIRQIFQPVILNFENTLNFQFIFFTSR